jgi:hypothetical protein
VGGGGVTLGVSVDVVVGIIIGVGGRGVAINPHDCRKINRRVKHKMRRVILG